MTDLTSTDPYSGRASTYTPERPPADPRDFLGASFRLQNPVWSVLSDQRSAAFPAEPGYNPMAEIRGTKYESRYVSRFYGSLSAAETRAIQAQIDREEKDREIGQAAGWAGTVADILAGSLDPTIALPGAVIMRGARGAVAVGRSAIASGAALGAQVAGQEAILQSSQATRSWEETAGAIATGTLLGALLGGAASGVLSRAEYGRAKAHLEDLRAESAERLGLPYEREGDALARAGLRDVDAAEAPLAPRDIAAVVDEIAPSPVGRAESVGAAAADVREVKPVSILSGLGLELERVPVLREILVGPNPVTRTNFSDNVATRRVSADLVETATRMEDHLQGRTTSVGPPAETHIRVLRDTMQAEAADVMTDAFARYRFGDEVPRFMGTAARIEDWRGHAPDKLTRKQFSEAVSFAMRNGDRHEIPEVQAAARAMREKVMDPLWEAAKKVFPDLKDLDRTTAESYMKRQWNQRAIRENPTQFVDMVTNWLRGEMEHNRLVQARVREVQAGIEQHERMLERLQGRIATLEARERDLSARLSERRVGAGAEADRAAALRERENLLKEQIEEIQDGIDWLKAMDLGPDARARVEELEKEARRVARGDRPMTADELDALEREETASILSGDLRIAAEMATGKRAIPDTPSFLHWVAKEGGIADDTGDARAGLGDYRIPGLLRRGSERDLMGGRRSLDDWGERLAEMDPNRRGFDGEVQRYSPDEVLAIFEQAARGDPPKFWIETLSETQQRNLRAAEIAATMDEALNRLDVGNVDMKQVSMLFRGEEVRGRSLADLDRVLSDMEAAGAAIPVSVQREAAENAVLATRRGITEARAAVRRAQDAMASRERRAAAAAGGADEVERAARQRTGRLGVLQERIDAVQRMRGILDDMTGSVAREIDIRRGDLEKTVAEWRGDTIAEAESAWKQRAKAEEGRAPDAARLRSADSATDLAVKRILTNPLDMMDDELRSRSGEIMNRLLNLPDGRLPYDGASGAGPGGFGGNPDMARWRPSGPFASREFMIPDNLASPFLVNDADHLISSYIRQTVPDIILAQKFGDPMMTLQIKAMREEWDRLIAEAPPEKRAALAKAKAADERDIAGMRDRLRGTYGISGDSVMQNVGRWARAARNVNTVVNMGSVAGYALGDAANGVFRVGLGAMGEAWAGYLKALTSNKELAARVKREYRAMGAGLEAYEASRMHALDDVANAYHNDTFAERTLAVSAERMNILNLNSHATNYLKVAAASAIGDSVMGAAQKVARGTASAKDLARLAESGIDAGMAERIARAFDAGGGEKIDGLFLPSTEAWTDAAARQAFEAAVARDVNMAVITPGQDKPLWFSNQAFGVIGQFKSYMSAFHSRVLLPNLQMQDARTLQGLGSAVMAGMLGYALMSVIQGRDMSKMTTADWVKEGLSRGGVFGWLEEGNGILSKVTAGRADVYNLIGATPKESSRYESRNIVGALLGPTAGKIQSLATVTAGLTGDEWKATDTRALRQLLPLQNLIYIRGLVDQVERSTNDLFGVQNLEPR